MSKKAIKKNIINNKKKVTKKKDPRKEAMNVIKIVVGVILTVSIFYMIGAKITNEYKLQNVNKVDTSVILASKTFSQKSSDYYVMFYDFNGTDKETIESTISTNTAHKFYRVNIADALNADFISIFSDAKAQEAAELSISGTTMIHIVDNKNASYVEGVTNIENSFKSN